MISRYIIVASGHEKLPQSSSPDTLSTVYRVETGQQHRHDVVSPKKRQHIRPLEMSRRMYLGQHVSIPVWH